MARSVEQFADEILRSLRPDLVVYAGKKAAGQKDRPPIPPETEVRDKLIRMIKGYLHEQDAVEQKNQLTLF